MESPGTDDRPLVLHLAIRKGHAIATVFLLISFSAMLAMVASFVQGRSTEVTGEGVLIAAGFTLIFVIPGICYAVLTHQLSKWRIGAVVPLVVLSSIHAAPAIGLAAVGVYNMGDGPIGGLAIVAVGLFWTLKLLQFIRTVWKCPAAIRAALGETAQGFEPIIFAAPPRNSGRKTSGQDPG